MEDKDSGRSFFIEEGSEDKNREYIEEPSGCYFVHGIKGWSRGERPSVYGGEISISLHKDGLTVPLRPYGYVIKLESGSIISAQDRDVATKYGDGGFKKKSIAAKTTTYRTYLESELEDLMNNTRSGSHNEIVVDGLKVEIVGAYTIKGMKGVDGLKSFRKACHKNGLRIMEINNVVGVHHDAATKPTKKDELFNSSSF